MDPNYVGALTVMLVEGTEMAAAYDRGEHTLPDQYGMLAELREMLAHTTLTRGLFMSNHASNYLVLKGRLNEDRERLLAQIHDAIENPREAGLRQEWQRG